MSAEAEAVGLALAAPGPRWFPGLGGPLAAHRWRSVRTATGLDRASYGTERYLARDPGRGRHDAVSIRLPPPFQASAPVPVEALHGEARRRYAALGLDFHEAGALDPVTVRDRLDAAFSRIADVPSAAAAVGAVLAALHALRPEGPEYDVSYSDPDLPFSAFVGVAADPAPHGDLRLAEGILHECMHLQLTLIEGVVPLVAGGDERLRSPWQGTMRPVQGILHGLYVFRAIQDFHRALLDGAHATPEERTYLSRRIALIGDEVDSVRELARGRGLTDAGQLLASSLLAR